jgi:non-specific serine/threonine protein kinase/serine/threonine-protein kinase
VSREPSPSARAYWQQVQDVFAAALEAEGPARAGVLDARCSARPELRAEVEALLAAHASAGAFITPRTLGPATLAGSDDLGAPPGTRIGAFQLRERIAQGGMGEVYRAERVEGEFSQQVAIKLIAARLRGSDAVRRFRAERQILASLQHPSIVTLLDGGLTTDGQPFIAMEYIDGVPITDYCQHRATALEARLRLFQQLCAAVGFAHRHLVVHRDLKPGNVFVTAEGVVKVLDFGVAKLLEAEGAASGATFALLGPMTPNYASPEQVRGLPVTTACDVYALGVMLYELLSGQRPYDTHGKTVDEVISLVVERKPVRPSAAGGAGLPYDSRRLRGDLDAVVLKAMEKDPDRRYTSAVELADDVERVLARRPIIAREPSFAYLARKAVVRHGAAFGVAAVALVLLVTALVGALWQARIAERERARAEQRFQQVRQLASYVIYDLQDGVARLTGATALRKAMVQKSLQYLDLLADEAGGDTGLLVEIAGAYHKLGDVLGNPGVANLGDGAGAIAAYEKARSLYGSVLRSAPAHGSARSGLARLLLTESDVFGVLGPKERAESALAASRAIWESLLQADPANEDNLQGLASVEFAAYQRADRPRTDASLSHMHRALAIFQQLYDAKPSDADRMRSVALCHRHLVTFHLSRKDDDRAFEHARLAAEMYARRLAQDAHDAGARRDYAIALSQMGVSRKRPGFRDEALKYYSQSLAIRRELWQSDRANVNAREHLMYLLTEIGRVQVSLGRWEQARTHVQEAIEHASALHGKVSSSVPLETLIQGYSHLGAVAKGLKGDPCPWFRRSVALTPAAPRGMESFQYRVAVMAAFQTARDGLTGCSR